MCLVMASSHIYDTFLSLVWAGPTFRFLSRGPPLDIILPFFPGSIVAYFGLSHPVLSHYGASPVVGPTLHLFNLKRMCFVELNHPPTAARLPNRVVPIFPYVKRSRPTIPPDFVLKVPHSLSFTHLCARPSLVNLPTTSVTNFFATCAALHREFSLLHKSWLGLSFRPAFCRFNVFEPFTGFFRPFEPAVLGVSLYD